jgi:hypothetical protein
MKTMGIIMSQTPNGFGRITERDNLLANERSRASILSYLCFSLVGNILLRWLLSVEPVGPVGPVEPVSLLSRLGRLSPFCRFAR